MSTGYLLNNNLRTVRDRTNEDRVFGTASARRFALRQMQRQFFRWAPETSRLVMATFYRH